jgi:hypothetical protein
MSGELRILMERLDGPEKVYVAIYESRKLFSLPKKSTVNFDVFTLKNITFRVSFLQIPHQHHELIQ